MELKKKESLEETVLRLKKDAAYMKVAILFLAVVLVTKDILALLVYYLG